MQNNGRLYPVELVHHIFDYLSTIDILQSFSNINSYFDNVLSNYNRYHVNFQSCHKKIFHLICSRLQPNQIHSLILSNKDDTPKQFQLMLSHWNIKKFQCLHAITFIALENNLLLKFLDNLNIQSLTIIPGYYSQKRLPKDCLKKLLLTQRLKRLNIYNASCINFTQLIYNLKYLIVHDCEIIELQQILSSIPMLQTLNVTNHTGGQWLIMNKIPIELKQLVLNLNIRISFNDIENLILKLINLKYFELQIKGDLYDLCNSERWSIITKKLITFDFNFKSEFNIITSPQLLINRFSSSFWLEEKRWFVAYNNYPSHIFTVPRFASTYAYYSKNSSFFLPEYSTISCNQTFFYDHINNLKIVNQPILTHRFINIKILSIKNFTQLNQLQFIIDLNQICCLKLIDTITTNELDQLSILKNLSELHISTLTKDYRRQLNGIKQIRTLYIQSINSSSQLCRQFPCIERLYIDNVKSYRQICYILYHLKTHLSYLSLSWSLDNQSYRLTQNLLQRNHKEFNSIVYRYHNRHRSTIHLWIDNSTEQLSHTKTINVCIQWLLNSLSWLSRRIGLSTGR